MKKISVLCHTSLLHFSLALLSCTSLKAMEEPSVGAPAKQSLRLKSELIAGKKEIDFGDTTDDSIPHLGAFPDELRYQLLGMMFEEMRGDETTGMVTSEFSKLPAQLSPEVHFKTDLEFLKELIADKSLTSPLAYLIGSFVNGAECRYYTSIAKLAQSDADSAFSEGMLTLLPRLDSVFGKLANSAFEKLASSPAGPYIIDYFRNYYYQTLKAANKFESLQHKTPGATRTFQMPPLPPFDYAQVQYPAVAERLD